MGTSVSVSEEAWRGKFAQVIRDAEEEHGQYTVSRLGYRFRDLEEEGRLTKKFVARLLKDYLESEDANDKEVRLFRLFPLVRAVYNLPESFHDLIDHSMKMRLAERVKLFRNVHRPYKKAEAASDLYVELVERGVADSKEVRDVLIPFLCPCRYSIGRGLSRDERVLKKRRTKYILLDILDAIIKRNGVKVLEEEGRMFFVLQDIVWHREDWWWSKGKFYGVLDRYMDILAKWCLRHSRVCVAMDPSFVTAPLHTRIEAWKQEYSKCVTQVGKKKRLPVCIQVEIRGFLDVKLGRFNRDDRQHNGKFVVLENRHDPDDDPFFFMYY